MTQLEVIRMIGDVMTEIDLVVGSLLPGDPNLTRLQDLRRLLDARQLIISREVIDGNSERFQQAAQALKAVNDEIRRSIRKIDDIAAVIQNVTRFLDSVTSVLTTVGAAI